MRSLFVCAATIGALAIAPARGLHAQVGTLSVEVGGGVTMGTGDFTGAWDSDYLGPAGVDFKPSMLLSGTVLYQVHQNFALLAGYGWDSFACTAEWGCPVDSDRLVIMGPRAGLSFNLTTQDEFRPWLRVMGTYGSPAFSGDGAPEIDSGIGYQVGAGLDVILNERFTFAPQARWGRVNSDVTFGADGARWQKTTQPNYFSVELALRTALTGQ